MRRKLLAALMAAGLVALMGIAAGSAGAAPKAKKTDVRAKAFKMTPIAIQGGPLNDATLASEFGGEPSIEIAKNDHVFVCSPQGLGSGVQGFVRIADWKHFDYLSELDPGGGGDCDVEVGADGAVYTANLQAWASAIDKSTDDGKSFAQRTEDPVEQDRQWLAPDPTDANVVYFAYHDFAAEAEIVSKSINGGLVFAQHSIVTTDTNYVANTYPNTFSGPLRVDPTDHNRLFLVYGISSLGTNEAACTGDDPTNCPFGAPETIMVATSTDGGLTWTNRKAMTSPPGSVLGTLPWIDVDLAGNVYITAAGHIPGPTGAADSGLFTAYSTDHGTTWSKIIKVSTGQGTSLFPTVRAGADGIVDYAWIQTMIPDSAASQWHVHFAQSRNAHSARPTFTRVTGPLIYKGVFDRTNGLWDFMDMDLDSFGYAHMVVGDTQGGEHVLWWRQDQGPSAYTQPCKNHKGCVYVRPFPTA